MFEGIKAKLANFKERAGEKVKSGLNGLREKVSEVAINSNILERLGNVVKEAGDKINEKYLIIKENVSNRIGELKAKKVGDGAIGVVKEAAEETGLIISLLGIGANVDIKQVAMNILKTGSAYDKIKEQRDALEEKGNIKAKRLGTIWGKRQTLVDAKKTA